jgi:hypothetical protein
MSDETRGGKSTGSARPGGPCGLSGCGCGRRAGSAPAGPPPPRHARAWAASARRRPSASASRLHRRSARYLSKSRTQDRMRLERAGRHLAALALLPAAAACSDGAPGAPTDAMAGRGESAPRVVTAWEPRATDTVSRAAVQAQQPGAAVGDLPLGPGRFGPSPRPGRPGTLPGRRTCGALLRPGRRGLRTYRAGPPPRRRRSSNSRHRIVLHRLPLGSRAAGGSSGANWSPRPLRAGRVLPPASSPPRFRSVQWKPSVGPCGQACVARFVMRSGRARTDRAG